MVSTQSVINLINNINAVNDDKYNKSYTPLFFPNVINSTAITGFTISDDIIVYFLWGITFLYNIIAIFGIVSNVANILCFIRQGFKDPVNVSLLGLAVSDIGCLVPLIWIGIAYNPAFAAADLPFDSIELQYLTGSIPHTTFTRITAWITALITLERCLCITSPLKVRQIVTTRRVVAAVVGVFLVLMASVSPIFVVYKYGLKKFSEINKTKIGLIYLHNRETVEKWSFLINNTLIPFAALVVIIISTIILTVQLHRKSDWLAKSSMSTQAETISSRNQKIAKMIVTISMLFIACFAPISFVFIMIATFQEISISGSSRNILFFFGGICIFLEAINSSMNIFIYYRMSSNYRKVFKVMFAFSRFIAEAELDRERT